MTAGTTAPGWSRQRWLAVILLVFGVQAGLIFWLSDRSPMTPRVPAFAPTFQPAPRSQAELIAIQNPTLFALPQPESFSGLALARQNSDLHGMLNRSFEWSSTNAWLTLTRAQLDSSFDLLMQQHRPAFRHGLALGTPELTLPLTEPLPGGPQTSQLRLTGTLEHRALLARPALPGFAATDLLSNTVVRLAVSPEGLPISSVLSAKSGSIEADSFAMNLARTLRFAPKHPGALPSKEPQPGETDWGTVVFEWASLPITSTNTPGASVP